MKGTNNTKNIVKKQKATAAPSSDLDMVRRNLYKNEIIIFIKYVRNPT